MPRVLSIAVRLCLCASLQVASAQSPANSMMAAGKPTATMVQAEPGVRLEVLDWGGSGRPLVFLHGAGQDAHEFDTFAPKFVPQFHVYALSRKGSGHSDAPAPTGDNYSSDRLADDVIAVCDALKLQRPVLIAHSIAGQELSSIGSRFPQKVSGLVYLDAGYSYALYSPQVGDAGVDAKVVQAEIQALFADGFQSRAQMKKTQEATARLDRDLQRLLATVALLPPPPPHPPLPPTALAMMHGVTAYTRVEGPVLAIFADPHDFSFLHLDAARAAALTSDDLKNTSAQIDAFQAAIPQAKVVRLKGADHFIFHSNEKQVYDLITSFVASLPR